LWAGTLDVAVLLVVLYITERMCPSCVSPQGVSVSPLLALRAEPQLSCLCHATLEGLPHVSATDIAVRRSGANTMLTCPMCKKKAPALERECPSCHADLSLLTDYVGNLAVGLMRADELTRAGMLGEAVWAYLEVLEVDPDNALARRQVGQVVTAVRQFDNAATSRRWLKKLQRRTRFRRWLASWEEADGGIWSSLFWVVVVMGALFLGYYLGQRAERAAAPPPESSLRQDRGNCDVMLPGTG